MEQAVAVMDVMMAGGDGTQNSDVNISVNENAIEVFENDLVEGNWATDKHEALVKDNATNVKNRNVKHYNAMKEGARANDEYVKKMSVYPEFHGWARYDTGKIERCNYVACYLYFMELAGDIGDNGVIDGGKPGYLEQRAYNTFKAQIRTDGIGAKTWYQVLNNDRIKLGAVTKDCQMAFLWGMAIHVATDSFAHSAYVLENGKYVHITHPNADIVGVYEDRIKCAVEITQKIVQYYTKTQAPIGTSAWGNPSDYVLSGYDIKKQSFKLRNISDFIKAIGTNGQNTYNANDTYFNALNYSID